MVTAMSTRLAAAPALTVSVRGTRTAAGTAEHFSDTVALKRPDRFHSRRLSDLRDVEVWYDGARVTVAGHRDRVFAQAPMPDTLDRALDAVAERYGLDFPAADLFYASPAAVLLTDATTGGDVGTEAVDGVECRHLVFREAGVAWELWIPTEGDPLPRRFKATATTRPGSPTVDVRLQDWNLAPALDAATFTPRVPADYEGIAMLQRAAVLAGRTDEADTTAQAPPAPGK
jgi:hypothetical protein